MGIWDDDQEEYSEYQAMLDNDEIATDEEVEEMMREYETEEDQDEGEYGEEQVEYKMKVERPSSKKVAYKLSSKESMIVNEATVRLEQARLYDKLLKHSFFDGVKTDPTALKNVENEVKGFILERLEILLGIKSKKAVEKSHPKKMIAQIPFNDLEIEALKDMASKITKGQSNGRPNKVINIKTLDEPTQQGWEQSEAIEEPEEEYEDDSLASISDDEDEYEQEAPVKQVARPVQKTIPKPAPKPIQKPVPRPPQRPLKKEVVAKKPLPKIDMSGFKLDPSLRAEIKKAGGSDIIDDETAIALAMKDIEEMKKRKPISKMSPKELKERNAKIKTAASIKKPKNYIPMPDLNTANAHISLVQQKNKINNPNGIENQMFNVALAASLKGLTGTSKQNNKGDDDDFDANERI